VRATLLLADSAQAIGGKLYILGGGWSVTGPDPTPSAIALKVEVPWDRANHRYELLLELLDADGHPVEVNPSESGSPPQPVRFQAAFEAGRPAGLIPGTPLDGTFAINLAPLPLEPGQRYAWRLSVDGKTEPDWQIGFSVRPRPA
jgi:hypothetical protein